MLGFCPSYSLEEGHLAWATEPLPLNGTEVPVDGRSDLDKITAHQHMKYWHQHKSMKPLHWHQSKRSETSLTLASG